MRQRVSATWKDPILKFSLSNAEIVVECGTRMIGDLECHRPPGFLLTDRRTGERVAIGCDINHPDGDDIAATQLAIDGEVEQRKIAQLALQLELRADRPDMLGLQWRLLPNDFTFVSGMATV